MRTLSLVTLSLILAAPAFAQAPSKPVSERSNSGRQGGKFDFQEQTYKLPKLLRAGELTGRTSSWAKSSRTKRSPSIARAR